MISPRRKYNERLFNSNFIRTFFHNSRFNWLRMTVTQKNIDCSSMIEIGCFDGRIFNYLPKNPKVYKGYDANWEGGLENARKKFLKDKSKEFFFANSPNDIKLDENEKFAIGVSIESFEHIPPELVCPYLKLLSNHIDGNLLITVPNEKGLFFLIKSIFKPSSEEVVKYNFMDYINLIFGRTNYVLREDHKGFDYDHLIYDVKKFFNIKEISSYPKLFFLPKRFSFGIGIVAEPKKFIS